MRAIWKGHIQFSLVTIPVRIYNAIDNGQTISFNLLSREGHNPVSYEKKDKVTGEPLRSEDIVKGYQYEPGQYVIIEQEDIDKVKLKSTRVIEIEGFVMSEEVHPTLFEAPYFIGPDGDIAAKTYGLLSETLRYPNEVRSMNEVPQLLDVKVDKEQLKLAKTLVDSMTTKFANIEMKDHYYDALKAIIDAKIEGKEIVTVEQEEPKVVDIMTALKASIDAAKKKPMEKATGESEKKAKAEKTVKAEKAERATKTVRRKAS
jgi:DNA end-binding protein Ku